MEPNSSTSSSEARPRRFLITGILLVSAWLLYLFVTPVASEWLGSRFESQILAVGRGRIVSPVAFVRHRAWEAVLLITALLVLLQLGRFVGPTLGKRLPRAWSWLPRSAVWVVCINLFLLFAGSTALWWMVLHAAHKNLQQTAFHIERILLEEAAADIKVVVLGSSQGQSEIHTGDLSRLGGDAIRVANLSFAGASAADLNLIQRHFQEIDPSHVVVYLSPLSLYTGATGTRWLPLLTFGGLGHFLGTDVWRFAEPPRLMVGVLGLMAPMLQQRYALQHAVFGEISERGFSRPAERTSSEALGSETSNGDESPRNLLDEARKYRLSPVADFQKRQLEAFLAGVVDEGRKIVVIDGQVNPSLAERIEPEVIQDYRRFVGGIPDRHPGVFVARDTMLAHATGDYLDLYHILPEVRTENTRRLASLLRRELNLPFDTGEGI